MFINSHIFQIPIERNETKRKDKKRKRQITSVKKLMNHRHFRTDRKKQAKYDCEEKNKGKLIGVYQ